MTRSTTLMPPGRKNLGTLWEAMLTTEQQVRDVKQVERKERIEAMLKSDVWKLDLLPLFQKLYDDYVNSVKLREVDPDTLKVFDDWLGSIDGQLQLGNGALERLAKRRLREIEAKERFDQNTQTAD